MVWWSGPKDQTVSWVYEAGLQTAVLEPEQKGVDEDLLEVRRGELFPLLSVSCHPVRRIQRLDFCLLQT